MDIGEEKPAIVIEPIQVPIPGHSPTPAPPEPTVAPEPAVPVADPELVPA